MEKFKLTYDIRWDRYFVDVDYEMMPGEHFHPVGLVKNGARETWVEMMCKEYPALAKCVWESSTETNFGERFAFKRQ